MNRKENTSEAGGGWGISRWIRHYDEIRGGDMHVARRKVKWALRWLLPYLPTALMDRHRARTRQLPNRMANGDRDIRQLEGLVVFTPVWGPMVEVFDSCLMRSLFSENNLPSLLSQGLRVELRVYTREADIQEIRACFARYMSALDTGSQNKLSVHVTTYSHDMDLTTRSLGDCLSNCSADQGFLMAMPDLFFGDSTVSNLVEVGMGRDLCIAAVHMRVNDDQFIELIKAREGAISNEELVSLALVSAHQNFAESFVDRPSNCSRLSGVSVQPLQNGLLLVTHHLPTVFFLRVRSSDVDYFKRCDYHNWDHEWPSILISEQRYKFIGSSDVAFVAELTGSNSHVLPVSNAYANDQYFVSHQLLHHAVNEVFMAVMRPKAHNGFSKPIEGSDSGGHGKPNCD